MKVGFIGLGVMGYPMAGHIAKAGFSVTVFNRSCEKAELWCQEFNGQSALTPREAATGADVLLSCVGNDSDVESVLLGPDGALAGLGKGAVVVDHTTTSAHLARRIHKAAGDQGVGFIDAPVSGGESGAQNGSLSVMCGGDENAFVHVQPVLATYAKISKLIGGPGSGQLTKMVNQICIAGLVQSLSEALNFGRAAGLDMDLVLDVISNGAAQSWQMENRAKTMLAGEFEFGFAVDWMRKDLGICLAQARDLAVATPVTELVDGFYKQVQANGGGRFDTSSLITLLSR